MPLDLPNILMLIGNLFAILFIVKYPVRKMLGIEKRPKDKAFYEPEVYSNLIVTRCGIGFFTAVPAIIIQRNLLMSAEGVLLFGIILAIIAGFADVYFEWRYRRESRQHIISLFEIAGLSVYLLVLILTDGFGLFLAA